MFAPTLCLSLIATFTSFAAPQTPAAAEAPSSNLWWADFDGDGLDDALAVHPSDGRGRLLRNAGDGLLQDVTRAAGLDGLVGVRCATWHDVDGDGLPELYVGTAGGPRFFQNRGGGALLDATATSGLAHRGADRGAHWLDFDRDGRADLHVQGAAGELLYRGVQDGAFELVDLGAIALHEPDATHPRGSADPEPAPEVSERGQPGATTRAAPNDDATPGTLRLPARSATAAAPAAPGGGYASVPCAFVNASAASLFDQATGMCVQASSMGTLGSLYPLSVDFNIDAGGQVGIGTASPTDRLTVHNGDILLTTDPGNAGNITIENAIGAPAIGLFTTPSGGAHSIYLDHFSSTGYRVQGNPRGVATDWFSTSPAVGATVRMGTSPSSGSGFGAWHANGAGLPNVSIDSDRDGNPANPFSEGELRLRSRGVGALGGQVVVEDNFTNESILLSGGDGIGGATLRMNDIFQVEAFNLRAETPFGATLLLRNWSGIPTVVAQGNASDAGTLGVRNGSGSFDTILLDGDGTNDNGGELYVRAADGSNSVLIDGEAESGGGALGLRTGAAQETLRIVGDDANDAARLSMFDQGLAGAPETLRLVGEDTISRGSRLLLNHANGKLMLAASADDSGLGASLEMFRPDGFPSFFLFDNTLRVFNTTGAPTIQMDGKTGAKNGVVHTASHGARLLYAVESSEVWFEDVGGGRLRNGVARIDVDPLFLETVVIDEQHPMRVFIALNGDCRGVFVEKFADHFVVRELSGGTSDAAFDWKLMAKRAGLEDARLELLEDWSGLRQPVVHADIRPTPARDEASELPQSRVGGR